MELPPSPLFIKGGNVHPLSPWACPSLAEEG